MRTKVINEIKEKYSQWMYYGVGFDDPTKINDEDMDLSLVMKEDNIQVWLEYEFGTIFIVGLTPEEQEYINELVEGIEEATD